MSTTRTFTQRALRFLAGCAVIAGVMLPAAALAQDDVYPTPNGPPEVTEPGPTPGGISTDEGARPVDTPPPVDTLPVTGGQLAGLALIGLGVTGVGVILVRIGRRRTTQTAH